MVSRRRPDRAQHRHRSGPGRPAALRIPGRRLSDPRLGGLSTAGRDGHFSQCTPSPGRRDPVRHPDRTVFSPGRDNPLSVPARCDGGRVAMLVDARRLRGLFHAGRTGRRARNHSARRRSAPPQRDTGSGNSRFGSTGIDAARSVPARGPAPRRPRQRIWCAL